MATLNDGVMWDDEAKPDVVWDDEAKPSAPPPPVVAEPKVQEPPALASRPMEGPGPQDNPNIPQMFNADDRPATHDLRNYISGITGGLAPKITAAAAPAEHWIKQFLGVEDQTLDERLNLKSQKAAEEQQMKAAYDDAGKASGADLLKILGSLTASRALGIGKVVPGAAPASRIAVDALKSGALGGLEAVGEMKDTSKEELKKAALKTGGAAAAGGIVGALSNLGAQKAADVVDKAQKAEWAQRILKAGRLAKEQGLKVTNLELQKMAAKAWPYMKDTLPMPDLLEAAQRVALYGGGAYAVKKGADYLGVPPEARDMALAILLGTGVKDVAKSLYTPGVARLGAEAASQLGQTLGSGLSMGLNPEARRVVKNLWDKLSGSKDEEK
jgi:hypothetical protein